MNTYRGWRLSGPRSNLCSDGCYMFSPVANVLTMVVKQSEIFTFKVNFILKIRTNFPPKQKVAKIFCNFDPYFVILAWRGDELCCGQAHNWVGCEFWAQFEFEGQGQSPTTPNNKKGSEPRRFAHLVQICWSWLEWIIIYRTDKLRFDGGTLRQTQATTIPGGQYWLQMKISYLLQNKKL